MILSDNPSDVTTDTPEDQPEHVHTPVQIPPEADGTYITRKQAADILGCATGTLANWAVRGQGPEPIRREGRRAVLYLRSDIEALLPRRSRP